MPTSKSPTRPSRPSGLGRTPTFLSFLSLQVSQVLPVPLFEWARDVLESNHCGSNVAITLCPLVVVGALALLNICLDLD